MTADADRRPRLPSIINESIERALRDCNRMLPAKVVKWDSSNGRADCQILIKDVTEDEEGERQVTSWAVVPGVPVQFLGAGSFRITCPISDGSDGGEQTMGVLIWANRSLDKWLSGNGQEVDPEFDHDNSLGDAVFCPGLRPFGSPWGDVPTDGISVGKDSGLQMKVTSSVITLAETAANAQFVALANLVKSRLDTLQNAHDTHNHPTAPVGPVSVPSVIVGPLADVAASKVKAE